MSPNKWREFLSEKRAEVYATHDPLDLFTSAESFRQHADTLRLSAIDTHRQCPYDGFGPDEIWDKSDDLYALATLADARAKAMELRPWWANWRARLRG